MSRRIRCRGSVGQARVRLARTLSLTRDINLPYTMLPSALYTLSSRRTSRSSVPLVTLHQSERAEDCMSTSNSSRMTFTVAACIKKVALHADTPMPASAWRSCISGPGSHVVLISGMLRKVFLICLWSNLHYNIKLLRILSGLWYFCRHMTLLFKNLKQRYRDQHSPLNSRFALLHKLDSCLRLLIGD